VGLTGQSSGSVELCKVVVKYNITIVLYKSALPDDKPMGPETC